MEPLVFLWSSLWSQGCDSAAPIIALLSFGLHQRLPMVKRTKTNDAPKPMAVWDSFMLKVHFWKKAASLQPGVAARLQEDVALVLSGVPACESVIKGQLGFHCRGFISSSASKQQICRITEGSEWKSMEVVFLQPGLWEPSAWPQLSLRRSGSRPLISLTLCISAVICLDENIKWVTYKCNKSHSVQKHLTGSGLGKTESDHSVCFKLEHTDNTAALGMLGVIGWYLTDAV